MTGAVDGPAGPAERSGPVEGPRLVLSVNVGQPRDVRDGGGLTRTAIWKQPVAGRVQVRATNIVGDSQADLTVHGGPDKAVYAYASEDTAWWSAQLGRPLGAGVFGENLTTAGVDLSEALIGEQWAIGSAVCEIAQPRVPCYKLGLRFDDRLMPRRFAAAGRPGAYLRVLTEGDVGPADRVRVVHRPKHGVSVGFVATAYHHDHHLAARLLDVPELPESWTRWAQAFTARAGRSPSSSPSPAPAKE